MRDFIRIIEESYAPEAFFWFDANKNECHMFGDEDADHATVAARYFGEQPVKDEDYHSDDFWVWNSAQIDHAIKNNWVRGRYQRYDVDNKSLSLQGNRRSVVKAARWFANNYPVHIIFVDFGDGPDSFHDLDERKSIALRGDRLAYFLKRGSVPSAMVMERQRFS